MLPLHHYSKSIPRFKFVNCLKSKYLVISISQHHLQSTNPIQHSTSSTTLQSSASSDFAYTPYTLLSLDHLTIILEYLYITLNNHFAQNYLNHISLSSDQIIHSSPFTQHPPQPRHLSIHPSTYALRFFFLAVGFFFDTRLGSPVLGPKLLGFKALNLLNFIN